MVVGDNAINGDSLASISGGNRGPCDVDSLGRPLFLRYLEEIADNLSASGGARFRGLNAAKDSPFIAPLATLLFGPEIIYNPVAP